MKVMLLAGEESGVIYAKKIAQALVERDSSVELRGYDNYGFQTSDLAVFGFWAVIRRIFFFLRVKRTMECALKEWRPDVLCTIDYPGLNLRLAAFAKSLGVRTVHVVCPQVWAWHQERIPKIERALDRLCCFLPFEPALFKPGFAEFVGHPLVDELEAEKEVRETGEKGLLAILPGSRLGEIEKHLPTLLRTAKSLKAEMPALRVVIPAANDKAYDAIGHILERAGLRDAEVTHGGAREILGRASCAAIASGTATFEAALKGCPFVVVYRVGAILAFFLRRIITGVKHVGLINVIAEKAGGEAPMREFLQEAFTVENVCNELRPWLQDESANLSARRRLAGTVELLSSDGSAISRIASAVLGRM